MNKLKLKKLLTLLVCLMLVASICLLAACNKEDIATPAEEEEAVTYTPSIVNGNFASSTSADSYPYTPASWTSAPDDSFDVALPDVDTNTVAGVISLDADSFNASKANWSWGDRALFSKYTADLDENYTSDDDVLMIYNKAASYYYYKSSSISTTANKYYKLTVDVRTAALGGNSKKGASLYLAEYSTTTTMLTSASVALFDEINVDEWTRYTFYIKSNGTALMLFASLGKETTDHTNANLTSGYAFFDNVTLAELSNEDESIYDDTDFKAEYSAESVDNTVAVDLNVPNANFDYTTSYSSTSKSAPLKYTLISNANSANYNRINLADYADSASLLGIPESVTNPGYSQPEQAVDNRYNQYVYGINANADGGNVIGFKLTSALTFKRGTAYKVSFMVNAKNVTSGKAYVALSESADTYASEDLCYEISAGTDGWKTYSFVVLANQNTALTRYFQFWLGYGDEKASGVAFFDALSVEQLTLDADTSFIDLQDEILGGAGIDESDYAKYSVEKTTKYDESLIKNGFFMQDIDGNLILDSVADDDASRLAGWTPVYDEEYTDRLSGVSNADVSIKTRKVVDGNAYTTPYASVSPYILEVKSDTPTVYALDYKAIEKLAPMSYYRFSMWVKTVDVPTGSGITLTVYDGSSSADRVILGTAFSSINTTTSATGDINGYRELVFYIHTDTAEDRELSFEVRFGKGGQFSETTLFSGTAYIANVSLLKSNYTEYTQTGTYVKSKDFVTTLSSTLNTQFDQYNMTTTKGFDTDGIVDEKLSDNFGDPKYWDYTKANLMTDAKHVYHGIVDTNRAQLIANLKAAAEKNQGTVESEFYFTALKDYFNSTAYTDNFLYKPAAGLDLEEYTYHGDHSALMVAAANQTYTDASDATKNKNFVVAGYANSSSITLSADSYYKLRVLVKTIDTARASVYLYTDNNSQETNDNTRFENISTTSETDRNGWKEYVFYVKTGFSSVGVNLGLYLGQSNNPLDTLAEGASTGGIVFFDRVSNNAITEEQYNAGVALAATEDNVNAAELTVDSFGLTSSSKHSDSGFLTPSSWTAAGTKTTNGKYGVVINSDATGAYDFTEYGADPYDDEGNLKTILVGNNGSNALVIYNAADGAYSYTSSGYKTFAASSVYKITVYAKTYGVEVEKNAYIKLSVKNYSDAGSDDNVVGGSNIIYFNSANATGHENEYQKFEFFVKTPDTALSSAISLTLGLGESDGDEQNLVSGFAIFDDIEFAKVGTYDADDDEDEVLEQFAEALASESNNVQALEYKKIVSTDVDPEPEPADDGETDDGKDYNWIIFTSVAFGALIVIVVIVYFVKKYLPKKKKENAKPSDKKSEKDKEDKYKNLKD